MSTNPQRSIVEFDCRICTSGQNGSNLHTRCGIRIELVVVGYFDDTEYAMTL